MSAPAAVSDPTATSARLMVAIGRLHRWLRPTGDERLTLSQWSALVTIADSSRVRIGDLVEREAVSAPTATRLVASLEELGLVSRAVDPDDRRSALVSATPRGKALLRKARTLRTERLSARLAALGEAELAQLVDALPVLERLTAP